MPSHSLLSCDKLFTREENKKGEISVQYTVRRQNSQKVKMIIPLYNDRITPTSQGPSVTPHHLRSVTEILFHGNFGLVDNNYRAYFASFLNPRPKTPTLKLNSKISMVKSVRPDHFHPDQNQ